MQDQRRLRIDFPVSAAEDYCVLLIHGNMRVFVTGVAKKERF